MGFYSSINFRMTGAGPGVVRVSELGQLADLAGALEVTRPRPKCFVPSETVKLWYGPRYDSDIETHNEAYNPDPRFDRMWAYRDRFPVDLEFRAADASDIAARLAGSEETIYRAYVSLGTLSDDLATRLTITVTENERYFCPGDIGFSIDPWDVVNERGDDKIALGFLELSISGHGYFFPQTAKTYIDILMDHPGIRELTDFIRVLWPQEPIAPPDELIEIRRDWMKSNWVYPLDDPLGWHWIGNDDV